MELGEQFVTTTGTLGRQVLFAGVWDMLELSPSGGKILDKDLELCMTTNRAAGMKTVY